MIITSRRDLVEAQTIVFRREGDHIAFMQISRLAELSSALAALERRLRVMESDDPVEDAIMGFADEIDQGPMPVPAGLACDLHGPASTFEEAVHAADPVFLLDVDWAWSSRG